jgi:glycogen debranching enzyme
MQQKVFFILLVFLSFSVKEYASKIIYQSKVYTVYDDRVVQRNFEAKALSKNEIISNYQSPSENIDNSVIYFRFSINNRDNEMEMNKLHVVHFHFNKGHFITEAEFGNSASTSTVFIADSSNLIKNDEIQWTIRLDMRKVINDFKNKGFYTFYNGEKLYPSDFKGVYIAGNIAPLIWDYNNLYTRPELELKDPDHDGIYETTLNIKVAEKSETIKSWKLSKDISQLPKYSSEYLLSDAIYQLSLEEMLKAVEPDSTFRTGKEWAGVWTRDISYSIILAMANLQPQVAKYSLMRKVKNGQIIQDTGTGGSYPVSSDRMIWAVAAWELYKTTGDQEWLKYAYPIIKNSIEHDIKNIYDPRTGLVKGESSFLDWREQSYPYWMQPAEIYQSECLGTNAVHYQANKVLVEMANILHDKTTAEKHKKIAANIKKGINRYLWLPEKGYYGQYLYGRSHLMLSPRAESLGEALCVLFDIAENKNAEQVISNVPILDFGIPCFYPQIPNIPPYHNNAVWPFVQAYWALASAKAGNESSVLESIAAIYRPAALFLTNKENFVADNGDFKGTQINSSNMLWSLSGNLAIVYKIFFGLEFQSNKLVFHPFVPTVFAGHRELKNFSYRKASLDIEMDGSGNKIKSFEINGKPSKPELDENISGRVSIKIILENDNNQQQSIHKVDNYFSLPNPTLKISENQLSWDSIKDADHYEIIQNGKILTLTKNAHFLIDTNKFSEYQVVAVDDKNIPSFASEPLYAGNDKGIQIFQMEDYAPISTSIKSANFHGSGYIEISKNQNTNIILSVEVKQSGTYLIQFRYANGNGPINTDNKCALRNLNVNGKFVGAMVFPQRGKDEWSNWGYTNIIQVILQKGKNEIALSFEKNNENMNGEINQALLDEMLMTK